MTDFTSAEKKQRVISAAIRLVINILFFIFTLIKASSGFTPDIAPHTNHSIKILIFVLLAADTLACVLDIYLPYIFHAHFIVNILFVIFAFLIVTAIGGILPAIPTAILLAAPFIYYGIKTRQIYDDVFKSVTEKIKTKNQ